MHMFPKTKVHQDYTTRGVLLSPQVTCKLESAINSFREEKVSPQFSETFCQKILNTIKSMLRDSLIFAPPFAVRARNFGF